jgi:hypothetical protein
MVSLLPTRPRDDDGIVGTAKTRGKICDRWTDESTQLLIQYEHCYVSSLDNLPYFALAHDSHRPLVQDDATMADEPDMSVPARLERVENRLGVAENRLGRV